MVLNDLQRAVVKLCEKIEQEIDLGIRVRGTVDFIDNKFLEEKLGIKGEIKFDVHIGGKLGE